MVHDTPRRRGDIIPLRYPSGADRIIVRLRPNANHNDGGHGRVAPTYLLTRTSPRRARIFLYNFPKQKTPGHSSQCFLITRSAKAHPLNPTMQTLSPHTSFNSSYLGEDGWGLTRTFPAPGSNIPLQLPPNKKHRDIQPSVFSLLPRF